MSIVLQGSTSGSITLQEPAVAGSTVLDLPATSGTILTTGSSGQSIPKAALPTGSVLQVVNATYSTTTSSSSSTFADTGLTASITPTSSSSKILVLVNQAGCGKDSNDTYLMLRLLRGSTTISDFERTGGGTASTARNFMGSCSVCYLDSPATTSSTTYKTQLASSNNNAIVYTQLNNGGVTAMSTITLLEIAA